MPAAHVIVEQVSQTLGNNEILHGVSLTLANRPALVIADEPTGSRTRRRHARYESCSRPSAVVTGRRS